MALRLVVLDGMPLPTRVHAHECLLPAVKAIQALHEPLDR